jgi:hypothetical protein
MPFITVLIFELADRRNFSHKTRRSAMGRTAMRTYTFYFADRFSPVQSFDILECEDDAEALERAGELLGREPERLAVEVWSDTERVFAFDRNVNRPPIPASGSRFFEAVGDRMA